MAKPVDFDKEAPLERIRGESKRANAALRDYMGMGAGRSIVKLLKVYLQQKASGSPVIPPTLKKYTLETWSMKNGWVERIKTAEKLDQIQQDRLWQERRLEVKQQDFNDAQRLRKLAQDILDAAPNFIISQRKTIKGDPKKGIPDQTIVTMKLQGDLAVKALDIASQIQRKTTGLEGRGNFMGNFDLNSLTTNQLHRLVAGDDVLDVLAESQEPPEDDLFPTLPAGQDSGS